MRPGASILHSITLTLFCAVLSLAPVSAHAARFPALHTIFGPAGSADVIRVQGNAANAMNVTEVHFPTGRYVQLPNGMWQEYGPEGAYGQLQETRRNEHSIFLYDPSSNVDFQLNVQNRQIFFHNRANGSNGPGDPITQVVVRQAAPQIGNAISEQRFNYSCNNGINIEARLVTEGGRRTLFARNAGAAREVQLNGQPNGAIYMGGNFQWQGAPGQGQVTIFEGGNPVTCFLR